MRPAFRRGWEGEGKRNRCPGAGQRAKPATRGQLFCFGKREGKALGVPTIPRNKGVSLPPAATRHKNGTLARRDADGRCGGKRSGDKAVVPKGQRRESLRTRARRPTGKGRGESASGSAQKCRTLKERSGKECALGRSRPLSHAPDRHRNGQDQRLGARSA